MGKNLETIGRMGKETVKFGADTLSVIAGSLIFPSYCRIRSDKIKDDLVTRSEEYVSEDIYHKDKAGITLLLGIVGSFASVASLSGFVNPDIPKSIAYCSSLFLGTNLASGLYEWVRATKYPPSR